MKAYLEFDLADPDQVVEHLRCSKARDLVLALSEIDRTLWKVKEKELTNSVAIKVINEIITELNIEQYLI